MAVVFAGAGSLRRSICGFVSGAVCGLAAVAYAQLAPTPGIQSNSAALFDKHAALRSTLANNPFGRPLVIESIETNNRITGDAYAVLDSPFAQASSIFPDPGRMCELITLHLNTKYCRPAVESGVKLLKVNFGKKTAQELGDTYPLDFVMQVPTASKDLLEVVLDAKQGPLGTSNYRIAVEAVPLPGAKTFLHLRYSYGYSVAGRIAMRGYLATAGSRKVGFTRISQDGGTAYIGGMRGAIERNTMRYYLAIDAYLATLQLPAEQRMTARLNHWFDATERYSEQLGEVDKVSYITMKKAEYARQQGEAAR